MLTSGFWRICGAPGRTCHYFGLVMISAFIESWPGRLCEISRLQFRSLSPSRITRSGMVTCSKSVASTELHGHCRSVAGLPNWVHSSSLGLHCRRPLRHPGSALTGQSNSVKPWVLHVLCCNSFVGESCQAFGALFRSREALQKKHARTTVSCTKLGGCVAVLPVAEFGTEPKL